MKDGLAALVMCREREKPRCGSYVQLHLVTGRATLPRGLICDVSVGRRHRLLWFGDVPRWAPRGRRLVLVYLRLLNPTDVRNATAAVCLRFAKGLVRPD